MILGFECLLNDNLEGFINVEDVGENQKPINENYKIGEKLKLRIKDINAKRRKISLDLVDEEIGTWEYIKKTYKVGNSIKGKIKDFDKNGLDVTLMDDIVGFCHKSQIGDDTPQKDELVDFVIQNIDDNNQKNLFVYCRTFRKSKR